jgi:hypothetical protein
MPRIRQKADEYSMRDLIAEINAQCGRYGYRSQRALGEALGVCQATAGNYLRNPESIQLGTLRAMVKLLRLDPVIVLRVLGYSSKEIKRFKEGFYE